MALKYPRILIDVSSLYYRALFEPPPAGEGARAAACGVFSAVKTIQRVERDYLDGGGMMYFLFDDVFGCEERKKDIDPDYKINRKKRCAEFYRGQDWLQLALSHYQNGHRVVSAESCAAGDFVSPVLESFAYKNYSVLIVSEGADWDAVIGDKVHWMSPRDGGGVIYTKEKFFQDFGFYQSPDALLLYKSLLGCGQSGIPAGVKSIPEYIALDIARHAGSVGNLFAKLPELNIPQVWKAAVTRAKGRVKLNCSLLCRHTVSVQEFRKRARVSGFNQNTLAALYSALGFDPRELDVRFEGRGTAARSFAKTDAKEEEFFSSFDAYKRAH